MKLKPVNKKKAQVNPVKKLVTKKVSKKKRVDEEDEVEEQEPATQDLHDYHLDDFESSFETDDDF